MRLPSLRNIPSLAPASLSQVTAQAVEELMREGESANTLASYRSALRYWAAWFGIRYGQGITLPLPANAVLQFIVDHAQRTTADGLAHELPPAIDQALVDAGFKGKPGPMACWRHLNSDPPCRSNIDPGRIAEFGISNCG